MPTYYVQIHREQPGRLPPDGWFPWINCKNVDETARLALHRFLRTSGYCSAMEWEPFDVTVYVALPDDEKRWSNGSPKMCFATTFHISKPQGDISPCPRSLCPSTP